MLHDLEPTLKPVTLNRMTRGEYLKAKEKFVRDSFDAIGEAINDNDDWLLMVICDLFRKQFPLFNIKRMTDKIIIQTLTNEYKKIKR